MICEDQANVREGLERLLKLEQDMEIVGLAQDGAEAVELVPKTSPDVILMDLKMPVMNGVVTTRRIDAEYPAMRVLVLTPFGDSEGVFDAIRAGASGYLLKDTPREKMVETVRGTMMGKSYVDPPGAGKLLDQVAS